jgi:ATP-dependent exoDNAse (exonuclease V) beta subunit
MNSVELSSPTVVDQAVRDELLDINQSFIVQAPAGSGKTELLTQRILALLANVEKPENLLAITFTRKAAAEMRERVVSALRLALLAKPSSSHELARWNLAKEVLASDRKNGWNLIDNPSRLNIYTIDALSARLTGALPLLSQTGTIPAIAEQAYPYYQQAAEQLLAGISSNDLVAENIKILLAHKDNNLKQVIDLLAQLLSKRLQWMGRINSHDHQLTCEQLFESLNLIVRENLINFYQEFPKDILSELPLLIRQSVDVLGQTDKKGIKNLMQLSEVEAIGEPSEFDLVLWKGIAELLLTSSTTKPAFYKSVNKRNGFPLPGDASNDEQAASFLVNKKVMTKILKDLAHFPQLAVQLNEIRLLPEDVESSLENPVLKAVIELLPIAAGHLKLVFQQYNILDFSELSLSSLNALGSDDAPSDVALALDYQIEHILIDEFQDTSTPQIRLLEMLTAGWDGSSQRSLFLVGDPMQSIYRFRDANVSLFMQIAQFGLGQIQPAFRQLQVNFRSKKAIIDWVNQQFSQVMPEQDDLTLSAVSYASSIAFHPDDSASQVKTWVTVEQNNNKAETQKILEIVKNHLQQNTHISQGKPLKTLAILARSRAHFSSIIDGLNENSIAYQAVDIEPLSQKIIVSDITRLALALTDPYDQLSWTACLRSPWFSLSLDDIRKVLSQFKNGQKDFPNTLKAYIVSDKTQGANHTVDRSSNRDPLSQQGLERLERILPILEHTIEQKGRKPFEKWLMGCFESVGGLLQIDINSEHQDLETCISTIAEFVDGGEILDRQGLMLALDSLYAAPNPLADNQIQIMTIHKSKGLEFDRVILPRLDGRSAGLDAPLLKWTEVIDQLGNSHNLLAISKQTGKENDSIYRYINFLDKQKEKFENQRILYVAATRAKSELHLFANVSIDVKATDKNEDGVTQFKAPQSNSFIGMLWQGVESTVQVIETLAETEAQVVVPHKLNESEIASIAGLDDAQQQLAYIFPSRKIKQTNLEKVAQVSYGRTNNPVDEPVQLTLGEGPEHSSDGVVSNQFTEQASIVGTVIHRQLEWLSNRNIEEFVLPDNWGKLTESQLLTAGISRDLLIQSTVQVLKAINKTLNDQTGRFILTKHPQAKSELTLHKRLSSGLFLSRIVDRTFVFDDQRWIVDYKSAEPNDGEDLAEFLSREIELYKLQMNDYVQLFKKLENRPIIAGLYFPMISHFEPLFKS